MTTFVTPSALVSRFAPGRRVFNPFTLSNKFAAFLAGGPLELGTGVSKWLDVTGNGNHLNTTQSGAAQPILGAGPNGTTALVFDGVNDAIGGFFTYAQPTHQFLVAKYTSSGTTGTLIDGNQNKCRFQRTGTSQMTGVVSPNSIASSATPTLTNWHLHELLWNASSSTYIVDGGSNLWGANSLGSTAPAAINLGSFGSQAADFAACSIAELWCFSAAVTGSDLTNLRAYFTDKFGVP